MIFAQEVNWCMKDCDKQRLQITVSINLWKILAGHTGDWFDVKTASICTTELRDALKSFILTSLKFKVAPYPIIVSLDTLTWQGSWRSACLAVLVTIEPVHDRTNWNNRKHNHRSLEDLCCDKMAEKFRWNLKSSSKLSLDQVKLERSVCFSEWFLKQQPLKENRSERDVCGLQIPCQLSFLTYIRAYSFWLICCSFERDSEDIKNGLLSRWKATILKIFWASPLDPAGD